MTVELIPGADAWSHAGDRGAGVVVLHGFTGNPTSVRGLAEALAAAGYHVELPRLPGHGTRMDDLLPIRWDDWTGEVEAAHERMATRVDHVVVAGLSMGGALTLWSGLTFPDVAGLICVNPLATPLAPEVMEMLDELSDDGMEVVPGIGSDIADPDAIEHAYPGTPVRPLISLMRDGVAAMADRYGALNMPLRLFTSRHDHVVEPANSEHLASTYGGEVEHTWLDRSYHVATQDFDRELIFDESVSFVHRVTGA